MTRINKNHIHQFIMKSKEQQNQKSFLLKQYQELYLELKKNNENYTTNDFYKNLSLYIHPDKHPEYGNIPFQTLSDFKNGTIITNQEFYLFPQTTSLTKKYQHNIEQDLIHSPIFFLNILNNIILEIEKSSIFLINFALLFNEITKFALILSCCDFELKNPRHMQVLMKIIKDFEVKNLNNYIPGTTYTDEDNMADLDEIKKIALCKAIQYQLGMNARTTNDKISIIELIRQFKNKYEINDKYLNVDALEEDKLFEQVLPVLLVLHKLEREYSDMLPCSFDELLNTRFYEPNFENLTIDDICKELFDPNDYILEEILTFLPHHFYDIYNMVNDNRHQLYMASLSSFFDNFHDQSLSSQLLSIISWFMFGIFFLLSESISLIHSIIVETIKLSIQIVDITLLTIFAAPLYLAKFINNFFESHLESSSEITLLNPN
jgi:hypothetical protein